MSQKYQTLGCVAHDSPRTAAVVTAIGKTPQAKAMISSAIAHGDPEERAMILEATALVQIGTAAAILRTVPQTPDSTE